MTQNTNKKVLIIISTRRLGGPGKGILQYLRHAKDQIDFTLCTFNLNDTLESDFIKAARRDGINVELIGEPNKYNLHTFKSIIRLIKDNHYQIIQTHEYKSHLVGLIASLFTHVKWVSWAHGWTSENLKIHIYNILDKSLHFFSSHAVGVSPKLVSTLKKIRLFRKSTSLILNAVDPNEINSDSNVNTDLLRKQYAQNNDFLIAIFGRLSPEKGQDIAIDALNLIVKQYQNIKLLIVGEGPEEHNLKKQIDNYSLTNHIAVIAYQNNLKEYFQAIDLTLLPSRSEGLPNVVLESMSLGTPVLAATVGGVPEIIDDNKNGWSCEPNNSESLANKLLFILNNPKELDRVKQLCSKSIFPKFSAAKRKDNILSLYEKII